MSSAVNRFNCVLSGTGPGRAQTWDVTLDGRAIAWYRRDPMLWVQRFEVTPTAYGLEIGFTYTETDDPFMTMMAQYRERNIQDRVINDQPTPH